MGRYRLSAGARSYDPDEWLARERIGAKRVYIICFSLFSFASVCCGFASSAQELIGFRIFQGLAGGLLAPMAQMMVARHAETKMAQMMVLVSLPVFLAPIFGPFVAGAILHSASWHWVFFLNLPIAVTSLPRCTAGETNLCAKPSSYGSVRDGGYAEQILVPHPRWLLDPENIDPALAATYACSGLTVYSAIRKLMPLPSDAPTVLIGAGSLGLAAISVLRAMGHPRIVSLDVSPDKHKAALTMGASDAVDSKGDGVLDLVRAVTGGLVLGVIDFANATETAQLGYDLWMKGGKLVLVDFTGGELTISLARTLFAQRSVLASATGSLQELREVLELGKSRKLNPIPITRMSADKANESLDLLHHGKVTGHIVLERT